MKLDLHLSFNFYISLLVIIYDFLFYLHRKLLIYLIRYLDKKFNLHFKFFLYKKHIKIIYTIMLNF